MASTTDDSRLKAVESAKQTAINNANSTYNNMINQTDAKYNELINASKDYATTQQELQQQNTDFAIEKINQSKEQAEKDYLKEQRGAYTDYQKATDQYGVNAEKLASSGLSNTGYSESSNVAAFTAYQNRYSVARESYNQAVLSYDNAIKEAQLSNNSALAQIAFESLQTQLQYSLEGFQYKNQLLQTKLNTQMQLDSEYNNRYQQVLSQINTENSLAEQIRQYNSSLALQREQFNWQKAQASKSSSSGGSSSLKSGSSSSSSKKSSSSSSSSVNLSNGSGSSDGWIPAAKLANSLGLPAAVKLDNVISNKEYEKKLVNGFAYYKKK